MNYLAAQPGSSGYGQKVSGSSGYRQKQIFNTYCNTNLSQGF